VTARQIDALKPRGTRYVVRDSQVTGLELRIAPSGKKTWSLRYRIGRNRRRLTIGSYPVIALADARDIAREALRAAGLDEDPVLAKRLRRDAPTWSDLTTAYVEHAQAHKRSWREDRRKLAVNVPGSWRDRRAEDIRRSDVRELLDATAATAPIAANRLRALLHRIFTWGIERDIVARNPGAGAPRPGAENPRDRVLTEDEIRAFWKATESGDSDDMMASTMSTFWRLRLVTAQRGVEVRDMRWLDLSDLDRDPTVWTIPAHRSKNNVAHRVPLSVRALEIIAEQQAAVSTRRRLRAGRRSGQQAAVRRGSSDPRQN